MPSDIGECDAVGVQVSTRCAIAGTGWPLVVSKFGARCSRCRLGGPPSATEPVWLARLSARTGGRRPGSCARRCTVAMFVGKLCRSRRCAWVSDDCQGIKGMLEGRGAGAQDRNAGVYEQFRRFHQPLVIGSTTLVVVQVKGKQRTRAAPTAMGAPCAVTVKNEAQRPQLGTVSSTSEPDSITSHCCTERKAACSAVGAQSTFARRDMDQRRTGLRTFGPSTIQTQRQPLCTVSAQKRVRHAPCHPCRA